MDDDSGTDVGLDSSAAAETVELSSAEFVPTVLSVALSDRFGELPRRADAGGTDVDSITFMDASMHATSIPPGRAQRDGRAAALGPSKSLRKS